MGWSSPYLRCLPFRSKQIDQKLLKPWQNQVQPPPNWREHRKAITLSHHIPNITEIAGETRDCSEKTSWTRLSIDLYVTLLCYRRSSSHHITLLSSIHLSFSSPVSILSSTPMHSPPASPLHVIFLFDSKRAKSHPKIPGTKTPLSIIHQKPQN